MANESFTEGISPGGLRNKSEIKLLVSYLLKKIDKPVSRMKICEIIQEYNIANYFEINQAITDQINSNNLLCKLDEEGNEVITLMGNTYFEIDEFENLIPRSIREKAIAAATKILNRDKVEKQSNIIVEKTSDGYLVTFEISHEGDILFKLTVFVTDFSQVELVKKNFCENAVDIYSNVMSALTIE